MYIVCGCVGMCWGVEDVNQLYTRKNSVIASLSINSDAELNTKPYLDRVGVLHLNDMELCKQAISIRDTL